MEREHSKSSKYLNYHVTGFMQQGFANDIWICQIRKKIVDLLIFYLLKYIIELMEVVLEEGRKKGAVLENAFSNKLMTT